jgi:hypothetical protein
LQQLEDWQVAVDRDRDKTNRYLEELHQMIIGAEQRLAALEEFRKTHEWTVWQTCLEGGPPSPADSSLDMTPPPATQSTGIWEALQLGSGTPT